jgi:hypothetical protein
VKFKNIIVNFDFFMISVESHYFFRVFAIFDKRDIYTEKNILAVPAKWKIANI